ncbi:hypothetical protein NSS64_29255 [Paenibacillus sp. FSL H8-0122]|uniref:hypothetical protein n=1 Tax=Paenibacillus sp. FSL H8-0122 TaxID=2954510 RepID=UPI0030FB4248
MDKPINLLAQRTDCMLHYVEPAIADIPRAGWIGGNAPEFFDNPAHLLDLGGRTYLFYLSFVHPIQPGRMISIFIPEEYEEYLEHNMYPDCPIKVIEHPLSAESHIETYTNAGLRKHHITTGEPCTDDKSVERSFLIKVGGTPRLLQNETYYSAKLEEEAFSFFFQVDEDGYPDTLLQGDGSYLLGFGALYVYAHIGTKGIGHPVAGFWQFS